MCISPFIGSQSVPLYNAIVLSSVKFALLSFYSIAVVLIFSVSVITILHQSTFKDTFLFPINVVVKQIIV